MINYSNFYDLIKALIDGGDNNVTADSFSGAALGNLSTAKDDYWKNLLENMTAENTWLGHWFIRQPDFQGKDTVMKYITDKADRDFNIDDFNTDTPHWNESVQTLIDKYQEYMGLQANGEIEVGDHTFTVEDIRKGDAGFLYGQKNHFADLEWIKPWYNVDDDTYKDVRNVDSIVPVLNSSHQSQFTRFPSERYGDFGQPGEERDGYYVGRPDMNNDGIIDASDAAHILTLNKSRIPTQEDLDKINFYGTGPLDFNIAASMVLSYYANVSAGSQETWEEFLLHPENLAHKDDINPLYRSGFLRLIMPKYLRRVEVEDLDRNFWVIAQSLAILGDYMFDEDSPLNDIIKRLLDETAQLWENILYLWVGMALVTQQQLTDDIQTIFIPVPNSEIQNYLKYDNFEQTRVKKSTARELLEAARPRLQYLVEQYPNSNLVIIPEIRYGNYHRNYYCRAIYAGVIIYQRNFNSWDLKPFRNPVEINLKGDAALYTLGGIKERDDKYLYSPTWSRGTATIGGQYYSMVRPEVVINPVMNNNHKVEVSNITINFHDAASELVGNNTYIPFKIEGAISSIQDKTILSLTLPADNEYLKTKGYFLGELLSYRKVLISQFEIMIRKIWRGNTGNNKVATVTVSGGGTTRTHAFHSPNMSEWRETIPATDMDGNIINYTATETINESPDEEWSSKWTRKTLNKNTPQTEIYNTVTHTVVSDAEFKVVKIGDFYPTTFVGSGKRSDIPNLSAITTPTVNQDDQYYDTATYGIGAYTLRKPNAGTNWGIGTNDQHLVFVDYNKYAQSNTIDKTEGSNLTVSKLNQISVDYITYLKTHTNKLGSVNNNGIYATKFGTSFWVGDAGAQWSAGIVHALVFWDGNEHIARVISQPRILDGYYTRDVNVFSLHGFSEVTSQWRRLCLKCSKLKITEIDDNPPVFNMEGGQIIWYDHWNDINSDWGKTSPRPNAVMSLGSTGELSFAQATPQSALPGTETHLALKIQYNGNNVFWMGGSDEANKIGANRTDYDYSTGTPLRFTENYSSLNLAAGTEEGQACYIR